jgi:hypothetical protein
MLSEYTWRNEVAKKERRNVFFVVEERFSDSGVVELLGRRDDEPFDQAA